LIVSASKPPQNNKDRGPAWYELIAEYAQCVDDPVPALFAALGEEVKSNADDARADVDPCTVAEMPVHEQIGERLMTASNTAQLRGIRWHAIADETAGATLEGVLVNVEDRAMIEQVRAALQRPELRRFFDQSLHVRARNEVSFVTSAGEVGRIDRLVEFEDSVWILDYKTGGLHLPLAERATPYVEQMRKYQGAVRALHRTKPVHAALIFESGDLFEIESGSLGNGR